MEKKLKIGMIGCGGIANQKHFPALKNNASMNELVAFCDIIKERAAKAAEEFGIPGAQVTTDYRELLANPDVEVVHICTPNVSHSEIAIAAFAAKKHVYCEKPMSHSPEEAQKMVDAWKASGMKFTVGYQNRFREEVMNLHSACEAGDLGEIYYGKAHAVRRRAVPTWGVFPNKALQGGGPLIDIGTHALDITLWCMDNYDVDSVSGQVFYKLGHLQQATEGNLFGPWDPETYEVEDSAIGFIKMKNGAAIALEAKGRRLTGHTIQESETAGIAFVHQELNLINDLTVYENIFLNREITGCLGRLKKKEMSQAAAQLFTEMGVSIDPDALVSMLKASEKQLIEIAKALFRNAKLIILDEPTTSLNNDEIDHLFQLLCALKEKGTSFIFISHKMPEIFTIADRYTVLRNGCFIAEGSISDITPADVTRLMVGGSIYGANHYQPRDLGEPVLELQGFSGQGFSNVDITVRKGEVLGVTGLQGSGSGELLRCIFGDTASTGGRLKMNGKEVKAGSIHQAMLSKAAMLPADRKENSVVPDLSLLENMYISEHSLSAWRFHINRKQELSRYNQQKKALDIKAAHPELPVTALSGGNQQ